MNLRTRLMVTTIFKRRRPKTPYKKKPPESGGVKFFNRLERRGPPDIRKLRIYQRWTKKVRGRMEKEGTWPVGEHKLTFQDVVCYITHLQKVFFETPKIRRRLQANIKPENISIDTAWIQLEVFTYLWDKMRRALIRMDVCKLNTRRRTYLSPHRLRMHPVTGGFFQFWDATVVEFKNPAQT